MDAWGEWAKYPRKTALISRELSAEVLWLFEGVGRFDSCSIVLSGCMLRAIMISRSLCLALQ